MCKKCGSKYGHQPWCPDLVEPTDERVSRKSQTDGSVTIWMNAMTCRKCLEGWYVGYDGCGMSGPCNKCGDTQPEKMTRGEYLSPWKPNATHEPPRLGKDSE